MAVGTRVLAGLALILAGALPRGALAQEPFEVLTFRGPTQCERSLCLSIRNDDCRERLEGFYNKEKGCQNGQICTNCDYGNSTVVSRCQCENPPFSIPATYNQECNEGKVCQKGEGECYRPCPTYLHVTQCPKGHCRWNAEKKTCDRRPPDPTQVLWANYQISGTMSVGQQASGIVESTEMAYFPMVFEQLRSMSEGYRIRGKLIETITSLETIFYKLDTNNDGFLNVEEYSHLPKVLSDLDDAVASAQAEEAIALEMAEANTTARRLQENTTVTPEICNSKRPRQFYCSFDVSCKDDCRECGWKSATDRAFSTCVVPTPEACHADGNKVYCASDELCHEPGDCSSCVDRPIVDHALHQCLAVWWDPEPLTERRNWVCRDRNKVGMPCRYDQDCIHGMRRCLQGVCAPFQPYNPNMTCSSDLDCPHLGYYCPADPTGGVNPYWIQFCRTQKTEGMTCSEDRECSPELRCNTGEPVPRCRTLFSLEIGAPAASDIFCSFGWRDRNGKCAPPAKSKEAGRACETHSDCMTTDITGRSGECRCKAWWDRSDPKYCEPVAGDYKHHQENLRNYYWYRASKCGSFWTEEECLRIWGDEAEILRLQIECERQQLSGGPYLPPADCLIQDEERFADACGKLEALRR